ncbi:MAG: hypothetical protein K2H89_03335 [Oscillospiraceae bacterium]|nr:hypothetical protein [Oscillospiraceae bacterium]
MLNYNASMLAYIAIDYATKAFKTLTNPNHSKNFSAASAYIGCACSYLNSARSLYFASHNPTENSPTSVFFNTFDVYVSEVLRAIDTGSLIYLDGEHTDLIHDYENSELRNIKQS